MKWIWVTTISLTASLLTLTAATIPVITSPGTASGTSASSFFYKIAVANEQFAVVDATKKFLINAATNQPMFCTGDAPQELIVQVSNADVETYLADRANRGFNCVWLLLVDAVDQTNAPRNFYGQMPFDGADFTSADPAYWAHVDYVLQRAAAYGITAVVSPAFVGLNGADGYLNSILGSSDTTMTAYGAWLGARYATYPNIIWAIGGDADVNISGLYAKNYDIAQGIKSSDPVHLLTFEACRFCGGGPYSSNDVWAGSTPLNVNWVYQPYAGVQAGCAANYAKAAGAFLPNWMGEDWYEGEHSMTALQVRQEGYWEILSGCTLGRLFGNNAIWTMGGPFDTMGQTWQSQLGSPGSVSQQRMGALFRSREFWKLVPDAHNTYLTGGFGSGTAISVLARTSDGQTMIAYVPNGNSTTVAVNMAGITSASSTIHGWWFNPQTGAATNLNTFSNSGSHSFAPPDSNDWVLVLDDNSAGLPAPGTSVATVAPTLTYNASGLPAGLSVNTMTGMISGTPSSGGTSIVTLSATNSAGTGNATLTLTIGGTLAPPVITSATTAGGKVGTAFSYQVTATNSPSSFGAAGLPSGLSVNASGLISGTPAVAGVSTIALSATNSGGAGNATLTLTVLPAAPAITSAITASGTVGSGFAYQITATNSPTAFGAGGLPAGLSVNAGGLISGTPTGAGVSTVALSATNSGGTGNATLTLTVALAAPAITSATTASATVGSGFSYQITATNSPTTLAAGGLPAGLSVNAGGLISGTPAGAGVSTVALSATNGGGTGHATLTVTVAPAGTLGISPLSGTTLPSQSVAFSWPTVGGADLYQLNVGSQVGAGDYFSNTTAGNSLAVSSLPCDGRAVYAQVSARVAGVFQIANLSTYTATSGCAALTAPVGMTLSDATVTFSWTPATGADQYWLDVGYAVGQGDIYGAANTGTSVAVTGIPCDGRAIFVQLWTHLGGTWQNPGTLQFHGMLHRECDGYHGQPDAGNNARFDQPDVYLDHGRGCNAVLAGRGHLAGTGQHPWRRNYSDIGCRDRYSLRRANHLRASLDFL